MSRVNSLPSGVVIPNEDEVSDDEAGFHATEVVVTGNNVVTGVEQVIEECEVSEKTVSIPGKKRKMSHEVEILNKVSTPSRKACEELNEDHSYGVSESPRRLKRRIDGLMVTNKRLKKKLRISQQKTRRMKQKIDTLTSVVDDLKVNSLVSSGCAELLEATFSAVPRELMKRLVSQKAKKNPGAYPPELRAFAMTLKFYSTKAEGNTIRLKV